MATAGMEGVWRAPVRRPGRALRWSGAALVGTSWISAGVFALYILAFYLVSLHAGHAEQWNQNLPGLYTAGHSASLSSMAAHLTMGAIVLLLGPVQLIAWVRKRWPALHRWMGRIYVVTSGIAGLGGLAFILLEGTIGGTAMNLGFGLYGASMLTASVETWRHARRRRFDRHRAWALRLFALAIGSWLYRMDLGFWLIAMHGLGHRPDFHGPFDMVLSFFFYLPNLLLVELYLRGQKIRGNAALRGLAIGVLNLATLIVAVGTYYFVRFYWGPAIVDALRG